MRYYSKPRVIDSEWVGRLLATESFTSKEAVGVARECGETSLYGPDLINRLRTSPDLNLIVVGPAGEGYHPHAKRYRLERVEEVTNDT